MLIDVYIDMCILLTLDDIIAFHFEGHVNNPYMLLVDLNSYSTQNNPLKFCNSIWDQEIFNSDNLNSSYINIVSLYRPLPSLWE